MAAASRPLGRGDGFSTEMKNGLLGIVPSEYLSRKQEKLGAIAETDEDGALKA
jgi:hypothetical protein